MKRVLVRAPLLSQSGYGVHSRQVFKWLLSRKDVTISTHVLNWGNTSWMVNAEMEGGLIGEIMKRSGKPDDKGFDISFQVQLPDEWDPSLAKFNVGISAFVETDTCNPGWLEACEKMDCIIVPTEHIKKTIERTGKVTKPIYVVSETFPDEMLEPDVKPFPLEIDTDFNFLIVGQFTGNDPWNDRKNIFLTLKWLCEAFSGDKDVGIILKTNHGRGTRIDRQITSKIVRDIVSEVRHGEFPKVHLVHGNLETKEVAGLYKNPAVKSLVSLTRGEGFGLPLLEASVMELPVIATNWSGHLDFLNKGKFIPIDYSLIEIPDSRIDNRIFFKGMKWANPNESDFKKKVLKFRYNYEKPKSWAQNLSKILRESLSQAEVNNHYDNVLMSELGT